MITKVYNIDEYRIEVNGDNHGIRFSTDKGCPHRHLYFDENGQTVECTDCKKQVTAWWALMAMARGIEQEQRRLQSDRKQLEEEKARNLTHKAAIAVEDAWRRHKYIPTCPHKGCNKPITPQDAFGTRGGLVSRAHYGSSALPMEMKPVLEIVDPTGEGK